MKFANKEGGKRRRPVVQKYIGTFDEDLQRWIRDRENRVG